ARYTLEFCDTGPTLALRLSATRRPPRPILFPYTTLFRSGGGEGDKGALLLCARTQILCRGEASHAQFGQGRAFARIRKRRPRRRDRKSTRLNSSHVSISYAVFCLKKKQNKRTWL